MVQIESKILKTDVTCVKFFNNYVLAGIGNNLNLFTKCGELLQIFKVLNGQKIHGIIPNLTNKIAVFGANQLKILEFDFLKPELTKIIISKRCQDWIFDLKWLEADFFLATIFAHNFVSLWNSQDLNLQKSIGCTQKCNLYSASLINKTWNDLFVFSGTVFGQILIWKPSSGDGHFANAIYRLTGHDGAIFSITYSEALNYIVSTSDDRTVRLWSTSPNIFVSNNYENDCYKIVLKHTMYGHIARVFRCKIVKNLIVTAGEDSFVHIWNLNGKLVRKFETHQNGCVWALDVCESNDDMIITGGGDSGVSLYPVQLRKKIVILDIPNNGIPKLLKLTYKDNLVVITIDGLLKYYNNKLGSWSNVDTLQKYVDFPILETSENKKFIAVVAGLKGLINIYKEEDETLKLQASVNFKNPDENRIYSLHWLTSSMFLTSSVNGLMHCWSIIKNDELYELTQLNFKFILPPCKERWATCAVLCSENNTTTHTFNDCMHDSSYRIIVGDRKGNIHLYELNKKDAIQSLKKAHCHLGVTALFYNNKQVYSLGRKGILNKYNMDYSTNQLLLKTKDKLPFSWLYSIKKLNNTTILFGFSGPNFIVYNLDYRRIILEINCGGGHRSWDILVTKSNLLHFYYIKEKRLNFYSKKWSNILTNNYVDGYHTKEINCGAIIHPINYENKFLFISGGEDTTIRLSLINFNSTVLKFDTINTVKSHLSSVRCITCYPVFKNELKQDFLIFSGGGRAQIIVQKISIYLDNNHKIEVQQLQSYHRLLNDDESETRIMDLVTINKANNIFLVAGCSDGHLKCFNVSNENFMLKLLCDIVHTPKCILRLSYLHVCDRQILLSMATDGKIVFWDFSDINNCLENLRPFFDIQVHQSGINSFNFHKINDTKYVFASGGDDNSIVLNIINFYVNKCELKANLMCKLEESKVHGAQITGIFINENYLITTSIDQHISVFKYKHLKDEILASTLLKQYCSSVSDIQGMQCIFVEEKLYVCVHGKGIEICCLSDLNSN